MMQASPKVFICFGFMVAGFTALLVFNILKASQLSPFTLIGAVEALLPSFTTLLGVFAGYLASKHFFIKGLSQQLHDRFYRVCARYDQFLEQLRELNNPEVDALLLDVRCVTESPEFFLFNSKFLAVADALATASAKERRGVLADIQSRLKPPRRFVEKKPCPTTGCDGVFDLNLIKGQIFRFQCDRCQTRYAVHISQNDKVVINRIPARPKRLRFTHFSEDLPEYLIRNHVYVAPGDLKSIAKTIVALYEQMPTLSYYKLKQKLLTTQTLRESLADIADAGRVADALLRSKVFFVDQDTGTFPGYNKPTKVAATEESVYLSFIIYICYKVKEDRQVKVDGNVVRKIMDGVLPSGGATFRDVDNTIRSVLENIRSIYR